MFSAKTYAARLSVLRKIGSGIVLFPSSPVTQ